jgi:four helix bundle protein
MTTTPAARSHRDLIVWNKAMDLVEDIYRLTARFPRTEIYRLTDQLCRAVVSVPSNIAEGNGRATRGEYAHQLVGIAKGSLNEVETQIMIAVRLKYITDEDAAPVLAAIGEVGRMLVALRRRLSGR